MLQKTPEFLDAMCRAGVIDKWYVIEVDDYGFFAWMTHLPETVYKIENFEVWAETNNIERGAPLESVSCTVRDVMNKKAKILPLAEQSIELWLNVIIPSDLKENIRVESYMDQNAALVDAEEELNTNFEVHTKRIVVKVP